MNIKTEILKIVKHPFCVFDDGDDLRYAIDRRRDGGSLIVAERPQEGIAICAMISTGCIIGRRAPRLVGYRTYRNTGSYTGHGTWNNPLTWEQAVEAEARLVQKMHE